MAGLHAADSSRADRGHPVWVTAITGWGELALAVAAFVALLLLRSAPQVIVLACSLAGWLLLGG